MTTEQIIEEREDSIKMKMRFKRFLSGFMAVATLASTIIQPVTVSASELEPEKIPFEQQYAELKDVQDSLDPNEIVKANDIELSYGQEFDVEVDLSGIEGVDESKIKILFHEAKNEAGTDFDTHTPDTYKAVYAVEPVSGHPAYRVSRNITVKEPKTEAITTSNSSENTTGEGNAGETEDIGTADDEETDRQTETEVVTDLTEESETTTDEETGLTVSDVMEQADEEGIDLYSLDEGESVTFMARVASTTSTKKVTVTRGACYQYSDYGYGSYLTYQYTVKFGSVSATAYCIQPEKSSPGSGTYDIIKLSDGKKLAKVCYYGTKASGDDGFFTEENGYGNLSTGARFILVHLAASYANSGDSAFSGASSKAKTLAMKLYNYCISQPNIPDVEMSFSDANVTAYVDGSSQRTKEITFKADELQSITMKLPSGVKLHNVTTGKTSKAGESVVISGGTKFYLSAPLTQVSDVAGSWSATMKGNITKDYSAYKISTGSGSQDLALVFGEGVDDEKYVDFKVTWVQYASVKVIKKDSKANAKLSGAVFGLYSDADCKNLITKLPATDANEELMADVEEVQEEQMQRIQLEKNCPASIFEGFRREEAMQTYEGIAMQFTRSKGYLTIQATEEGYSFIFYDSDLHEIQGGDYDNPDASIQEAAYEILKSERMDDLECVKVDYKEFEEMTIQHSKDLLQEGELRATSEIGRNELALNSLSRAEVERGVLYHAQAVLEDMGMEQEVELLAARVYGSRSRQDLYREDSDLDVVISYRGNIREDSFFNELNAHGIAMAGIKVDINPIAEERITLAEYMKEADAYLDQQEIKKLASDLDNFSYDVDTYEYNDTIENREEQVEKLTEDILNKKTEAIKDWLLEVSEESDIDSDVITACSLLSRLEDTERLSIFDKQPEQEQPEATISFYVAECMEFPVMGEYHNNLTLEEAIKIYESIPAERMHGGKGIGFDLQDGDKDYSGEYELMCWDRVDRELIDMIPHYKESPLVQKAINDMEKYLNEKHGKVQEAGQTVEVKQEVPEAPVKKESVSVEPNWEQNKEPAKGGKGELKKSVLQSLKEFQARAKAQEQKETATEKSKARKKGEVEL